MANLGLFTNKKKSHHFLLKVLNRRLKAFHLRHSMPLIPLSKPNLQLKYNYGILISFETIKNSMKAQNIKHFS